MIRLVVHGATGRIGGRTCTLACNDSRFELVAEIDRKSNAGIASSAGAPVDAIIDFSSDEGARSAAQLAVEHGAALLVGTTGLSRQTLSFLEVASRRIPLMVAPNTSLGVAVINHLVADAARLLGSRFTIEMTEVHHAAKRDAPSGTALRIAETLRRRAGVELPAERIHAVRAGDVVGEHSVEFFSPGERIRISHAATSRDLFAHGALDAIAWLQGQKPGRYSIEDALGLV